MEIREKVKELTTLMLRYFGEPGYRPSSTEYFITHTLCARLWRIIHQTQREAQKELSEKVMATIIENTPVAGNGESAVIRMEVEKILDPILSLANSKGIELG